MSLPSMMFYPGDYLRDTGHLSTEEHGGYLLLLCHAWTQNGVLPFDDELLRRITRMAPKAWAKSRAVIMAFWHRCDDGWHQKRMDKELEKARAMVAKKREAVERTQQWRVANPQPKQEGRGPPIELRVMHNERITEAQRIDNGRHNVMPLPQSQPVPTIQKEVKKDNSLPSNLLDGSRAREENGQNSWEADLGIEPPKRDDSEPVSADQRFVAIAKRTAKAMELRIPYGEVRSAEAQSDAILAQPQAVGADVAMGLKWQPCEPSLTPQQQIALLLGGATSEQVERARRAFLERSGAAA